MEWTSRGDRGVQGLQVRNNPNYNQKRCLSRSKLADGYEGMKEQTLAVVPVI